VQPSDLLRNLPFGLPSGSNVFGGAISSSEIYPDLLGSYRILASALSRSVPTGLSPRRGTFREQFGFGKGDSAGATARAVKEVKKRLDVTLNKADGLVTLQFRDSNPRVAAAFLDSILQAVNEFNMTARQSQAGAVRKFLEVRIQESKDDLAQWEEALATFRERNLRFANAPQLALEEARLQRRVRLAESIYSTLSQQREIARIDEVRDTPTLTIVEPALPPALPAGFSPIAKLILGALAGSTLSAIWVAASLIWGGLRQSGRPDPVPRSQS
jgi:uncharacterized protein involved in exopolysaccharide biosynthesis